MTISEQCSTCASFADCTQRYGKYMVYRAQGWRPEWTPNDGADHPVCGCRWYERGDGAAIPPTTAPKTPEGGGVATLRSAGRQISGADLARRLQHFATKKRQ